MTSINDIEKKRGRGRPKTDAVPVLVRLPPADVAALDAHIAAQPDPKPTRPEAIRRVLATTLGRKAAAKPASATAPAVLEKAARARSKAASAADEAMSGMDASAEVKATRRRALVEKPPMVAKARTKRRQP